MFANFFWNASGWPFASTGNGVLPVVSTPMPMTCSALETLHGFLRRGERLLDGDLRAVDVIRGMLPGEVRVARQDHALRAVRVSPDGGGDFRAVGDVDDEGANRVRAVVQTDGVLRDCDRLGGSSAVCAFHSVVESSFQ